MVEAVIVAVSVLASTGWLCRFLGQQAAKQEAARTLHDGILRAAVGNVESAFLVSQDDTRDVLRQLVRAVQDQHHADLITTLATALQAEVDQIVARQTDHNNEWFDLATRVQNGAGHRTLRFPS